MTDTATPGPITERSPLTLGALVAELAGTYVLLFFVCGSVMVDARTDQLGHLGVSIAPGLIVAALVAGLIGISGAHFNPAVTLGLWAARAFPARHIAPYVAVQVVGAGLAALTVRASLGDVGNIGATLPANGAGQAFVWELVLTAVLLFVVLTVAVDPRGHKHIVAPAIGGVIFLAALVGGPISGASMNPARTLGPVIGGGPATDLWVYLTAPPLGALVAVAVVFGMTSRRKVTS